MNDQRYEEMTARIERLETHNRRMKRFLGLAGVLFLCLGLTAAAVVQKENTRRLQINDRRGIPRIDMNGDAAGISIVDQNRRRRLFVGLDSRGLPNLTLYGADGRVTKAFR